MSGLHPPVGEHFPIHDFYFLVENIRTHTAVPSPSSLTIGMMTKDPSWMVSIAGECVEQDSSRSDWLYHVNMLKLTIQPFYCWHVGHLSPLKCPQGPDQRLDSVYLFNKIF